MTAIRKFNNAGAVAIPWATAQDERLSFTARGVLAYVLSLPDGWEYSIERIARSCTATVKGSGREAVTSAMRELENAGYRRVVTDRDERGRVHRWAEFAFVPVPEWAAAAEAERYKRSHKTGGKCAPVAADRTPDDRTPATRNMAPTGKTPGGTVDREPGPREPSAVRETTPENNTHTEVCVSPEQHDAGRLAIERTTHPEAARLLTGPERDELAALAGALIAAGWTRAGLEAKLNRRTNAATHSPRVVIGRVLEALADEAPPAPPRTGGANVELLRMRAFEVAARFEKQGDNQHGLWQLTRWIHRANADELTAWLANPTPIPEGAAAG